MYYMSLYASRANNSTSQKEGPQADSLLLTDEPLLAEQCRRYILTARLDLIDSSTMSLTPLRGDSHGLQLFHAWRSRHNYTTDRSPGPTWIVPIGGNGSE